MGDRGARSQVGAPTRGFSVQERVAKGHLRSELVAEIGRTVTHLLWRPSRSRPTVCPLDVTTGPDLHRRAGDEGAVVHAEHEERSVRVVEAEPADEREAKPMSCGNLLAAALGARCNRFLAERARYKVTLRRSKGRVPCRNELKSCAKPTLRCTSDGDLYKLKDGSFQPPITG